VVFGPTAGSNNEIGLVTARSGNVLTVTRGQEGTTAQSWPASTQVAQSLTAGGLTQLMGDHTTTGVTPDPHAVYLRKDTVTTQGDLYVTNASAAVIRLPVGSDGQVLTADSTQVPGVKWAAAAFANVLTTFGDLVQAVANGVSARLGIGAVGQILTAVQNAALVANPGSAPSLALISGTSTLANTTLYSVVFAWRNNFNGTPTANGITLHSPQASLTTSGSASTQAIQVTCPVAPSGGGVGQTPDALLVYLGTSTSGPWYLMSTLASPSTSASNVVTLTAPPNTANAQPVTTNTTGGVSAAWAANAAIADPTTTRGDLIARGASALGRLAVGANQTLLSSNGTDPSWSASPTLSGVLTVQQLVANLTGTAGTYIGQSSGAPASGAHTVGQWTTDPTNRSIWICTVAGTPGTFLAAGFANPMTTNQDVIVGGSAGAPSRLGVGTNGQVLTVTSGNVGWANSPAGFANPMTATQDLIVGGTSGAAGRLGVGANGQVLTVASGAVGWANNAAGFANPMTTSQDLIVGGASGSAGRLGVGANSQVLTVTSGNVGWANNAAGFANPMTTSQDVIVGSAGGSAGRLGVGSNGQVLTVTSGNVGWANSATGFTNPMTTLGDLIAGDTGGAAIRLAPGANGQVLSIVSGVPAWAAGGGGGGGGGAIVPIAVVGPLTSSQASVTFASIPQTYRTLKLRVVARLDFAATENRIMVQFNSDTGANYDWQELHGSGTGAFAGEQISGTAIRLGIFPAASSTSAALAGMATVDLPNYTGTTFHKVMTIAHVDRTNTGSGSQRVYAIGAYWRNTAAVTSIVLTPSTSDTGIAGSGNFVAGSYFCLYGETDTPVTMTANASALYLAAHYT
jgi:hypothetical protein